MKKSNRPITLDNVTNFLAGLPFGLALAVILDTIGQRWVFNWGVVIIPLVIGGIAGVYFLGKIDNKKSRWIVKGIILAIIVCAIMQLRNSDMFFMSEFGG
jgi:uncharacterized membrane protein YfcA